ncbi:Acetyl-CoA acetyltransferase [Sinomonas atrocyanea]|uniref:Acetyl-CoA acetyltransferase n=1 Tax=Sinomonas atrocyanea TaxID=37927 RepID=A0A127A217_9MICC|nr:acetyl-CoA C-acetyltransferase [Sinomonas atrocyanea]AMM32921.1 Acetyl-CoA acetyltransferase [Sinomonas atrocyanea]GEB65042.1 acetyl-CoA acetyltransferase [Sinomonas atrocyanea]GGG61264.1 acetyl-CoA acetyltransferase [Sinomonas atrocyanea]
MPEAVIVSAVRSPIGRARKGSLREMRADDMAAQMVLAALSKVPELDPAEVEDLMLGCGMPEGESGQNLARVVAVRAGLDTVPGTTVTRFCASSLQTTRMAMHAIRAGEGEVFISAGVESPSRLGLGRSDEDTRNPRFRAAWERTAQRAAGAAEAWRDPREDGRMPDVYIAMGQTAENVAQLRGISREAQDSYAVRSQERTEKAQASGFWDREISPLTLPDGTVVTRDDSPRPGTTLDAVAGLPPAFRPDGTVTAGNACPLNDGAAALVIMSDRRAKELQLTPLARIVSTGVSALSPEIMGLGPVEATKQALARAGMTIDDVDLAEINEAFAAQVIPSMEDLVIPEEKLNVNGGAIALGHPWGMTGARITATLLNSLQEQDKQVGLETMCVGGGQGMAMVLERLS